MSNPVTDTPAISTSSPLPAGSAERRKGERRKVLVGPRKPCPGNARITVREKDGVVDGIIVHCTCGEEILIQCVYDAASN